MIKETKDINLINKFLGCFNISINEIGVYSHYNVYILDNKEVAFLAYDLIYDRIEIEYVYVLEEYRNRNIASEMLSDLCKVAEENKCLNITLEVRNSNVSALNLYKKNGFKEVARREKYYGNEDGILMIRELV